MKAIDLGMPSGTLWAECNIGAQKPEEYGNYFAWGDIAEKQNYIGRTCETYDLDIIHLITEGFVNNLNVLSIEHDAAYYILGKE